MLRQIARAAITSAFFAFMALAIGAGAVEAQTRAPTTRGVQPENTMAFAYRSSGGNCAGCEWISADGPITNRTPDDFRRFFDEHPSLRGIRLTVMLNSDGGNLAAGLMLGRLIHEARLWTGVGSTIPNPESRGFHQTRPGVCFSACAYAFLGGRERFAEPGSLGFHQFYRAEALTDPLGERFSAVDLSDTQRLVGLVALYLKSVGADIEVLFVASQTLPNDMYRPSGSELARLRITTPSGPEFSGWRLEPHGAGAVVTGTMRYTESDETQMTLFCRRNAPGRVMLMASSHRWAPSGASAAIRTEQLRRLVSSVRIEIGRQVVRQGSSSDTLTDVRVDAAGRAYLTVALSREEYLRGLESGLRVDVDVPGYLGHVAVLQMPQERLRAHWSGPHFDRTGGATVRAWA